MEFQTSQHTLMKGDRKGRSDMNSDAQRLYLDYKVKIVFSDRDTRKDAHLISREAPQKTVRSGSNIETQFKVAYRWQNMKPQNIMVLYMGFAHLNGSVVIF